MRGLSTSNQQLYISPAAVLHNLAVLRAAMPKAAKAAAVIKADAYGHGALHLAPLLQQAGVEALAVTKVSEGAALRGQGISGPIWLLMGAEAQEAAEIIRYDLWPITSELNLLKALSARAQSLGIAAGFMLKVDTGMNRLGLSPDDVPAFLEGVAALPALQAKGLVSHLAHGGSLQLSQPARQVRLFNQLLRAARNQGLPLPYSSVLNSGGVMRPPAGAYDLAQWVRLGVALYGGLPDVSLAGAADLRAAMSLHARIIALHQARAGSQVSYGGTYTVPVDTHLAIVPIGYAEGYHRAASNRAHVLINGMIAQQRGMICMNMMMVDVGHMKPLPKVGDEVVLLGRQGGAQISIEDVAAFSGTISYEIMCSLGAGLPHRYLPPPCLEP